MTNSSLALGIDVGGSGIKGALVDLERGEFASERFKISTPKNATPEAVANVVAQIVDHFSAEMDSETPVGVTVPAIVKKGVVKSMANLDEAFNDMDVRQLFSECLDRRVAVMNDADAAGIAEQRFGAASGENGLVILTTLGTGVGVALIHDSKLIPNCEMGHIQLGKHKDAEKWVASSVRLAEGISYKRWARRLTKYYKRMEWYLSPDLFVVGGGVSRFWDRFGHLIACETPIVPAKLRNAAGIIGAAVVAAEEE